MPAKHKGIGFRYKWGAEVDNNYVVNLRSTTTIKGRIMRLFCRKKRKTYWDHAACKYKAIDVDYLQERLGETNKIIEELREDLRQRYRLLLEIGGRKHLLVVNNCEILIDKKWMDNEDAKKWARTNNYEYIDTYGDLGELWTEREKKAK